MAYVGDRVAAEDVIMTFVHSSSSSMSGDAGSFPAIHHKSVQSSSGKPSSRSHWSLEVRETLYSSGRDGLLHVTILGGSDHASFCWISDVDEERVNVHSGQLVCDDIVLEVQGEKVAGYTQQDLLDWLWLVSRHRCPVLIKTVSAAFLTKSLPQFLTTRFKKDSVDQNLQQIIRKNVYRKALPCTTRAVRQGELDGVDYKFLTVEEFLSLEKSGGLLESGIYNGNYYGTPKPSVPVHPTGKPYTGQIVSDMERSVSGTTAVEQKQCHPSSSFTENQPQQHFLDKEEEEEETEDEEDADTSSVTLSSSQWPRMCQQTSVDAGVTRVIGNLCSHHHRLHHHPDSHLDLTQLPFGWEKVTDPDYGVYYIDHVNRRTQYDHPSAPANASIDSSVSFFSEAGVGKMKENNLDKGFRNASSVGVRTYSRQLLLPKTNIELKGEFINAQLMKSARGLGFTIVSAEDSEVELLQIKTILPNGPADIDGQLQRGDVLVYVDKHCIVGFSHSEVISLFQSIPIGSKVSLEVCRGYPLPFDPDDPSAEVITTVAVTLPSNYSHPAAPLYGCGHLLSDTGTGHPSRLSLPPPPPLPPHLPPPPLLPPNQSLSSPELSQRHPTNAKLSQGESPQRNNGQKEVKGEGGSSELTIAVVKGIDGFGFTIADSSLGQKVKQVIDCERCKNLAEGDIVMEINGLNVKDLVHTDVVEILKGCPRDQETIIVVQRGGCLVRRRRQSSRSRLLMQDSARKNSPVSRNEGEAERNNLDSTEHHSQTTDGHESKDLPSISNSSNRSGRSLRHEELSSEAKEQDERKTRKTTASSFCDNSVLANRCISGTPDYIPASAYCNPGDVRQGDISAGCQSPPMVSRRQNSNCAPLCPSPLGIKGSVRRNHHLASAPSSCPSCRTAYHYEEVQKNLPSGEVQLRDSETQMTASASSGGDIPPLAHDGVRLMVRLNRQESGFGIRIVGGIEEGSQVAIGYIVPGGSADVEGHLEVGDEILAVNQQSVLGASHHQVVSLMSQAAQMGFVILDVWKHANQALWGDLGNLSASVSDVILTRKDGEGFGFVIVSSVTKAGSVIAHDFGLVEASDMASWVPNLKRPYPWLGKIIDDSPAGCCEQLHVGDYILAINGVDIGNMPHQEIVNFIKASGLSIVLTVAPVSFSAAAAAKARGNIIQKFQHPQKEDVFNLIELRRGSRGFGFSIRGGKEFDGMLLYVLKVAEDGPAKLDGRLQIGDQILEINGCNTLDITHTEAIDLIQNSGASLSLLVKRSVVLSPQHTHEGSSVSSDRSSQHMENMTKSKGSQMCPKTLKNNETNQQKIPSPHTMTFLDTEKRSCH